MGLEYKNKYCKIETRRKPTSLHLYRYDNLTAANQPFPVTNKQESRFMKTLSTSHLHQYTYFLQLYGFNN